uniref:Uncharacterized protein n=1 Tax=Romanomermis culicivorax TaxID=13658 RepID=A0A915I680_ROMCU
MNIAQDTFCGSLEKYKGVGISVKAHSQNIPVAFGFEESYHTLTPGYEIDVIIKLTKYIRKTEHLGRCTNRKVKHDGLAVKGGHAISYAQLESIRPNGTAIEPCTATIAYSHCNSERKSPLLTLGQTLHRIIGRGTYVPSTTVQ